MAMDDYMLNAAWKYGRRLACRLNDPPITHNPRRQLVHQPIGAGADETKILPEPAKRDSLVPGLLQGEIF
jgi:hypothetical protein